MTDEERFELALLRIGSREAQSIGTQSERALHRGIKYFLDPDEEHHEIPVKGFIADICDARAGHIYEIQTRDFGKLREKLAAFLPEFGVTVVYPVMRTKYLCWVDPESGEVLTRRKSPRKGLATDILAEMSALREFFGPSGSPDGGFARGFASESGFAFGNGFARRLDFMVVLVDGEEYRLQDGWGSDGKRGSHGIGKTPFQLAEVVRIETVADLRRLLPAELRGGDFTRKELAKALKLGLKSGMKLSFAKNTLEILGLIAPCGKRGRETLYKMISEDEK